MNLFEFNKPLLGRARGGVVVDDRVRIEHPLLKHSVAIPIGQIAAVVEPVGTESDPLLARDVRILTFASGGGGRTNLVLVFRSPVVIDGFKLGAQRVLAISGRERRRGVYLDAVGVDVRDPQGLADALRARRVPSSASLASELISLVARPPVPPSTSGGVR